MNNINERSKCPRSDTQKYWAVMTLYERFEHVIALILSMVISIIIIFALIQLVREVFNLLISNMLNPLDHGVFQVVFGMIMTLLIAMEFKHSILKVLERQAHIIQARGVVMIAMLALTRKLIILDFSTIMPSKLAALGFVILVLVVVYYLLKQADSKQLVIKSASKDKE